MFNTETQDPKNPLLEEKSIVEKQNQLNPQEVETVELIVDAIKENNQEEFSRLLTLVKNPQTIDTDDVQNGYNALLSAVLYGHIHFVAPLIQMGADGNKLSKNRHTPISMAISSGNAAIVNALIAAGVVIDDPNTLMLSAVLSENAKILEILIALGANVNTRLNTKGEALLHWACRCPNGGNMITALCKAGAIIDELNHAGETPVWIAAYYGHAQAISALWTAGANIHTPNKDGMTPLFIATEKRHLAAIQFLLAVGADASKIRGGAGLWKVKKSSHRREYRKIINCLEKHFNHYPTGIKTEGFIANGHNLRSSVKRANPLNVESNNAKKPLRSVSAVEKTVSSPDVQPEQKSSSEPEMLLQFKGLTKSPMTNTDDVSAFLKFVVQGN